MGYNELAFIRISKDFKSAIKDILKRASIQR